MRAVLLRGGGDLASGVALRLARAGISVVITEIAQPLAVRRLVSFAEAVYRGEFAVEGLTAKLAENATHASYILQSGKIPVLVDPLATIFNDKHFSFTGLVDARMLKQASNRFETKIPILIGLGPGFIPGKNCDAAIETQRGHALGRVLWDSPPAPDTGIPEGVRGHAVDRVLRSTGRGALIPFAEIGDHLQQEQPVAEVGGHTLTAPFEGVLRGLLHPGVEVHPGMKIGDLDPRGDPRYCSMVSDKALAVGGGVLEALLSIPGIRSILWN